jgi:hypothetical protein
MSYPIELNDINTIIDINIIPFVYYDILIGMCWLDHHHAMLHYYNKTFTCLTEEGKWSLMKGVLIFIRKIIALQLKRCFKKGGQMFANHVEEPTKGKGQSLEYFLVL